MANKPTPGIEKHMAMRPQSGTAWILKPSATAWTPGIGGWSGQSRVLAGLKRPDQWKRQQSRRRPGRFLECGYAAACGPVEKMGLINDPDTVAAEKPDKYGLMIDHMKDGSLTWDPEVFGYSSGVIGLQLFLNKKFDASKWSVKKYMEDAGSVEPPYLVGMACSLCHVSFNPSKPPQDPVNPKWENITSNVGNNYFREGMLFGHALPTNTFAYQYLYTQEPGTSETSRFPSDFIDGPILINSIYRLGERLKLTVPEKITPAQRDLIKSMYDHVGLKYDDPTGALGGTETEPTLKVPHVLMDGSDSMGLVMASTRVYVK